METAIWQNFNQEEVILVGISNTNNQSIISDFVEENGLTFPILYDSGSSGGVQGGDTYDLYYMPNDGSPYPRDFVIDQEGLIVYANNEIDTEWMLYEINNLIDSTNGILGDIKSTLDSISGHGITATISGNGLHLYRKDPFGVTSPERNLMNVVTSEANNIADLPRTGRHGYTVRIVNSGEDMDTWPGWYHGWCNRGQVRWKYF